MKLAQLEKHFAEVAEREPGISSGSQAGPGKSSSSLLRTCSSSKVYVFSMRDAKCQARNEQGFMNKADQTYLNQYAIENLVDLIHREHLNVHQDLMSNQSQIGRVGRAHIIDLLFEIA